MKKSFEMEEERYESLVQYSSRLLTCISILAVAVIASIRAIQASQFEITPWMLLLMALVLVLIASSFFVALLAQLRKPYKTLPSPKNLFKEFAKQKAKEESDFSERDLAEIFADTLNISFYSMRKKNDSLKKKITASTWIIVCSVALILLFTISYGITYLVKSFL